MMHRKGLFACAIIIFLGANASGAIHYVDVAGANAAPPYTSWSTAATVIQDAVDAASAGDLVLVTNGVYAAGGRQLGAYDVTNRVALTNAVTVQSVNGPAVTFVQGYQVASQSALSNAIRCAWLGTGAVLSGFTLTNGSAGSGNYVNGGGVYCVRAAGNILSNCVLIGNYAAGGGGGACQGTLINCVLRGNYGQGGGGALDATLVNCLVTNNSAGWAGATLGCIATNCLLALNHATNYGGASGFSTLVNCTVTGNSLQPNYAGNGGGCYHDTAINSIVYGNTAPNGSNFYSSSFAWTCSAPLPAGTGNFTNAPIFVDSANGNFQPQSNSPTINAGRNAYLTTITDLAGNTRISGGTVDAGAYEFQGPASSIAYYWLQYFRLPADGTADFADPDDDGLNNWQEWICGTDPTNALSVLSCLSPAPAAHTLNVTWASVPGRTYFVQRATALGSQTVFTTLVSNYSAASGNTTTFTDTTATGAGPFFYRVGVEP